MQKKHGASIGVFDSGFGGIDILRRLVEELPEYDYLYLGDTARAPYGDCSPEAVYEFTTQVVDFLYGNGCDLVILACNTVSSDALQRIQEKYMPERYPDRKILGVLIPTAEESVRMTVNKRIGVIATEGTVRSGAFVREIAKLDSEAEIFQRACPLLVPLVEMGEHDTMAARVFLEGYLDPIKREGVDTLILGCTHYGIFEDVIRQIVGPNTYIVSGAAIVPKKLKRYLDRHPEIDEKLGRCGTVRFCSTDLTDRFETLGGVFFGKDILVERVSIG